MMKKTLGITALVLLIFAGWVILYYAVCGGWGNVNNVQILEWESAIYSDDNIEAAFQTVKKEFTWHYVGCTLTELYYSGDDYADRFNEVAERRNYDEAMIILSTIETGSSGENGFSPNSTYPCWEFILVRNAGGDWKVVDAGY